MTGFRSRPRPGFRSSASIFWTHPDAPARFEYCLTDVGKDLYPVILTLRQWGDRHLAGADGPPTVFTHRCGHPLRARLVCESCGEPAVPGHSRPAVAG